MDKDTITITGIDQKCAFDRSELLFWKEDEDDWGWRCPDCHAEPVDEGSWGGEDVFMWECGAQDIVELRPDVLLINSGLWAREWRKKHDD